MNFNSVIDDMPEPMKQCIPAVAYLRMSDDDQTTSIPQQQNEIYAWAEKQGYKIIREYVDEGISAAKDDTKRVDFQRLLSDVTTKGDFLAVLCWHSNRFSRKDSVQGSFAAGVLQENRIVLDTVKDGLFDFNTDMGRMKWFMGSEQNNRYVRDLAEVTVRGRQDSLELGSCPFGRIPYGYARRYFSGDVSHLVKRTESFRKPRGWQVEVVIVEEEAEVIRFIFKTYAEQDISRTQIAKILHERGIPSPEGKGWHENTLRHLLTNPAYIGVCEVDAKRFTSQKKRAKFATFKPSRKEGIFPAIIKDDVFGAVQKKIRRGKDVPAPRGETYSPLCGVVFCGKCGSRMCRETARKKAGRYTAHNGNTYERARDTVYFRYKCNSYHKNPSKGCRGWGVGDDELLPRLLQVLRREVDTEILRALHLRREKETVSQIDILEQQRKEMLAKVDQAEERYLTAPDHLLAGLEKKLTDWKSELETLEMQLRVLNTASRNEEGLVGLLDWWEGVKDQLLFLDPEDEMLAHLAMENAHVGGEKVALEYASRGIEASKLQEFLKSIGCKVTLVFKPKEGTSQGARWRRKTGRTKAPRYFEVDWANSKVSAAFGWDGVRVCAMPECSSSSARRRRRGTPRRSAHP
jgi:DNA invertase Pin-like site-specific DNA recombinase